MSNIYVYNKGEFNQLSLDFLNNKAIIRIHNIKEKDWVNTLEIKNIINLYFDDINKEQLLWYEKIYWYLPSVIQNQWNIKFIKRTQALQIIEFIKNNKNMDFIIHCEFGKSRSVAIAMFIKQFYNGTLRNKEDYECQNYNRLVFNLLKKLNK